MRERPQGLVRLPSPADPLKTLPQRTTLAPLPAVPENTPRHRSKVFYFMELPKIRWAADGLPRTQGQLVDPSHVSGQDHIADLDGAETGSPRRVGVQVSAARKSEECS